MVRVLLKFSNDNLHEFRKIPGLTRLKLFGHDGLPLTRGS